MADAACLVLASTSIVALAFAAGVFGFWIGQQ
jgi:hypothetical protein